MKKRRILAAAFGLALACALPACDMLQECGTCEFVTVDAEGNETRGTPLPFCGDDLIEKENEAPSTVGGITTYWDCY